MPTTTGEANTWGRFSLPFVRARHCFSWGGAPFLLCSAFKETVFPTLLLFRGFFSLHFSFIAKTYVFSFYFFLRKGVFPPSYELRDVRLLTPFFVPTVCVHTPRQAGVAHMHSFCFWRKKIEGVRWDEACSDRRHDNTYFSQIQNTEYNQQKKNMSKIKKNKSGAILFSIEPFHAHTTTNQHNTPTGVFIYTKQQLKAPVAHAQKEKTGWLQALCIQIKWCLPG